MISITKNRKKKPFKKKKIKKKIKKPHHLKKKKYETQIRMCKSSNSCSSNERS